MKEMVDFLVPSLLVGLLVGAVTWIPAVREMLAFSEAGAFVLGICAAVFTGVLRRIFVHKEKEEAYLR